MADATQQAKQLGLAGLAYHVFENRISHADFQAGVAFLEKSVKKDLDRLHKVPIIAKDKDVWENDYKPKLQQTLDLQLKAIEEFYLYVKRPSEAQIVKGLRLLEQAADMYKKYSGAADAGPASIQEAVQGVLGDSATLKAPPTSPINPSAVSFELKPPK